MSEEIVSARGERAAIGGYLPQFDEFAWFVYLNLINKNLEWIRIADPKAEKLDDIQYSTHSEIHAYQVKWTIVNEKISYANFKELIPLITSSWKSLMAVNPEKKIFPHLITNKEISSHDSLKDGKTKLGSFEDFISEVWNRIKSNQSFDVKWKPIIQELQKITKLHESEFNEFVKYFDFQYNYKKKEFKVKQMPFSKEDEDLVRLAKFLLEEAGGAERNIEFSREKIIQRLGWAERFKTIFNHELIVDRHRYQPIQSTIDLLNSKLSENKNGYLFLLGGPGSGKSTLLTQWSKGLKERVIRYYAFDFVNPSSPLNYYERGDATSLFFDLVFQLKELGIYKKEILPYKDLRFLKEVFEEQLKGLGQYYNENNQKTIIVIDGLDHVPREYKPTINNFLRELPLPASLPEGVLIILGSQSFELDDIPQEIKSDYRPGSKTIHIDSLNKEEVYRFIDSLSLSVSINGVQKLKLFEKSQGHPLYLSYLTEKLNQIETIDEAIDEAIDSFEIIEGNIDAYYRKIWDPIQSNEQLVHLLGLIARVNGSINLNFVQEWGIEQNVLKLFRKNALVLFNKTGEDLSFFHNSFKQFLLHHTSLNYLTDKFDPEKDLEYQSQLGEHYRYSKVEKSWKRNHHLFYAKKYDEFVSEVTPDSFTAQLINFRPAEEIKQDARLGIEIARKTIDIKSLIRYLFSLAEIESRLFNIDPSSFTEELLLLNKFDLARNYLRTGNTLLCDASNTFKAARLFIEYDYRQEGEILFNLAYPEIITETGINIDNSYRYEEIKGILEEWIYTFPYFESTEKILHTIKNIVFTEDLHTNTSEEKEYDLYIHLLTSLGHSLIDQNKWEDFYQVLKKINTDHQTDRNALFFLIKDAIEHCLSLQDNSRANEFLTLLITYFPKEKTMLYGKIHIADLIYKVTQNTNEVFDWIKEVKQPSIIGKNRLGYNDSFDAFRPLIKFNKLLNICQQGVPITTAIPSVEKGADEEILVEFERMLCLITQILSDGILQNPLSEDLTKKVYPIVRFYYKNGSHRNNYWYKLSQSKGEYFDFLIHSVSLLGAESLEVLGNYLFRAFLEDPEYWSISTQRKIIKSLLNNGFNHKKAKMQLKSLEESMLLGHDINGRINECLAHSKVYFILDEAEEAEQWLRQAIKESIGVGYRKDYQFSTWIGWLRKINQKAPGNAPERIRWFLSHLNHLKETTEGRAYWYASEELLEVTYEYSIAGGLEQTIWQLDHDLVDFTSSMSIFIKYFVKKASNEADFKSITQLYNYLFLLLSDSADTSLLNDILRKGHELLEEKFLKEYIPTIIFSINIKAYEETRHYLLSEIETYFSVKGIMIRNYYSAFEVPSKKERGAPSSSSNTLILRTNHEKLGENEVLEQVGNFDDFKRLIQEEDKANSFFDWSKVIEKIAPLLSLTQIKEIVSHSIVGKRESGFYAKLSETAAELGDETFALSLANKSIELSSQYGWVKFHDGGTRIKAFSALKKIHPSLSSNKALEVFTHDIVNSDYPSSYIEHLEDIIPLLTETYNEEEFWPEIFGYLQRLMSNSKPIENLPTISPINMPISETLVEYLVYLSKSSVLFIKEQSTFLIAKLIDQNSDYALSQLINKKMDDYLSIDIIMALFGMKSPKVQKLKLIIQNLSLSKDYDLRENSKHVLSALGEDIPVPPKVVLPHIYYLHIPEDSRPKFAKEFDPHFPEIDINDPRDLIRLFEPSVEILSNMSALNESNIIYRAYTIMKEIGQEEEWSTRYETKLRSHLEEIGLKYPYPRPRIVVARRAIMQVICELIDSGTIDIENDSIRKFFKSHDYDILHFNDSIKPDFIQTIKERDFGGIESDWLHRTSESPRLVESLLYHSKNYRVIGEYSRIINLDWGSPTEEYMLQITAVDKFNEDDHYIFGSLFHQPSNNYHNFIIGVRSIILIRDHRFDQFDLKSRWIAINPVLARYLGWKPEPSKLFAWKNSQGKLMAESIYWLNGNTKMPPRKYGEVGEGWFVIVSEDGLEQIKSVEPNLFLQKKLTRSRYEDSALLENKVFNVTKV